MTSLYAIGTSTRDATTIIKEPYAFNMESSYISKSTKQLWPKIEEFKTKGLEKVLGFVGDHWSGISKIIYTPYPSAKIQKYVVHQIRNRMKFVSYKDKKEFVIDMKKIYKVINLKNAEIALNQFEEKWAQDYPFTIKSWRKNFDELVAFFDFPHEIRKCIYTTNGIENLNQKIRKITKK